MRAYYSNSFKNFLNTSSSEIFGELSKAHFHSLEDRQKNAWLEQIDILKEIIPSLPHGHIFFEFAIPRMGKRVDNILVIDDIIFVLEFKVGFDQYHRSGKDQVLDYALDLKNFHEGSHHIKLIPILIATEAKQIENVIYAYQDLLYKPLVTNKEHLLPTLLEGLKESNGQSLDPTGWSNTSYKPTPTIIEAAQALYKKHSVEEISRSDSGAKNLSITSDCIQQIIESSKRKEKKSICFVTGVPGAGKTLAGLNIANQRRNANEDEHAVFLSGNGPLVEVLREALARDESKNSDLSKKEALAKAKSFIQNIHHFRDDALVTQKAPTEKVVIFDEAQRAWSSHKASDFMKRKKGVDNFNMSEPQFLIHTMDRHADWCTIVCLIGGGQEINSGEAGLEEWFNALKNHFLEWDIYYSNLITEDKNYLKDVDLKRWIKKEAVAHSALHLSVSVRSFRSEKLSEFIHALLDLEQQKAAEIFNSNLSTSYPIVITRDLELAKEWLAQQARGNERVGIVASSNARRLRPYGVDVKNKLEAPLWFLNDKEDIRSSFFLEEVATEFDIQGLELDWTCVCWGADFYFKENWHYRTFKGTQWQNINKAITKEYLLNAYRVLLTRARQGMVIFVPKGNEKDQTRAPEFYEGTYQLLKEIGVEELT